MEPIDAFIDRLPKVELHLHLVGSASVPTVLELARRHPDGAGASGRLMGRIPRTAAELAAFYEFRDFPHFADVYGAVSGLVREPADVADLVLGAARDLAGQNVRYAELTVTPYTFTAAGMPVAGLHGGAGHRGPFGRAGSRGPDRLHLRRRRRAGRASRPRDPGACAFPATRGTDRIRAGGDRASRRPAPTCSGRCSVPRSRPGCTACRTPVRCRGPRRSGRPLDGLRAERIGHGISCLDDPALVTRLRESQIPLEVCPDVQRLHPAGP